MPRYSPSIDWEHLAQWVDEINERKNRWRYSPPDLLVPSMTMVGPEYVESVLALVVDLDKRLRALGEK